MKITSSKKTTYEHKLTLAVVQLTITEFIYVLTDFLKQFILECYEYRGTIKIGVSKF